MWIILDLSYLEFVQILVSIGLWVLPNFGTFHYFFEHVFNSTLISLPRTPVTAMSFYYSTMDSGGLFIYFFGLLSHSDLCNFYYSVFKFTYSFLCSLPPDPYSSVETVHLACFFSYFIFQF